MKLYTAEILFRGDGSVLRDAAVVVDERGTIVEVGAIGSVAAAPAERHAFQVLMPGVVNAHTHLTDAEITTPVPGGGSLPDWVRRLLTERLRRPKPEEATEDDPRRDNGPMQSVSLRAVASVLAAMRESGTVAIGEICNGTATLEPVHESGMLTRFSQEVLAFRPDAAAPAFELALEVERGARWSDRVRPTVGIHAPYSVSPELALMIRDHNRSLGRITYEHLVEDPAERELYESGTGPWKEYLERIGAWDGSWKPPGMPPLAYYDTLGLLTPDLAAVHLADATREEIALVVDRGVRAILSPTSNLHIGDRLPPMRDIVEQGLRFALGTDGRGSNPSVDVFDEARLLAERFEWLDGLLLFDALTSNGADVLGFDSIGRIAPGLAPGLVAAEVAGLDGPASAIARRVIVEPISRRRIV